MTKVLRLNDQQKIALQELEMFLASPNKRYFGLLGPAGTGKTKCVIANFIKNKRDCYVLAPTHKAKNVLHEAGISARTFHSFLCYKSTKTITGKNKFLPEEERWQSSKILIIDECSMIKKEEFKHLEDYSLNYNTKIIFTGDAQQLHPVESIRIYNSETGQYDEDEISVEEPSIVFSKLDGKVFLEKIERTSKPELMKLYNLARESTFNHSPQLLNSFLSKLINIQVQKTLTSSNGPSVVVYRNKQEFDEKVISICKENKNQLSKISFIACSNGRVSGMTKRIYEEVYSSQYSLGQTFAVNEFWNYSISGREKNLFLYSCDLLEVLEVRKIEQYSKYFDFEFKCYELKVFHSASDNVITITKIFEEQEKTFDKIKEKKRNELKSKVTEFNKNVLWKEFETQVFKIKPPIKFFFANTVYKAQGSTFDITLVDLLNIRLCRQSSAPEAYYKEIYTALTRGREKTFILV